MEKLSQKVFHLSTGTKKGLFWLGGEPCHGTPPHIKLRKSLGTNGSNSSARGWRVFWRADWAIGYYENV